MFEKFKHTLSFVFKAQGQFLSCLREKQQGKQAAHVGICWEEEDGEEREGHGFKGEGSFSNGGWRVGQGGSC